LKRLVLLLDVTQFNFEQLLVNCWTRGE